jgi:hypothetical protein
MRRKAALAACVAAAGALAVSLALTTGGPDSSKAASHREAPLISQDPTGDVTDLYAFVSPDKPDTVTLIADWIPFEDPAAGPNWYQFSENARYEIRIDNTGDARADIVYRFVFTNTANSKSGALPLGCIASPCQTYTLTRIANGTSRVIGRNLPVAPTNIGPRTFPGGYAAVRAGTVRPIPGGQVFAGPADDPFFGDIAAAFDLVGIRKGTGDQGGGKDSFAGYNVHVTALQIAKSELKGAGDVIGVWATASRPGRYVGRAVNKWVQVSRLGNPLVNELLIETAQKDEWNGRAPAGDARYDENMTEPKLAPVLNSLYGLAIPTENRTDLLAIFHQGLPGLNQFGNRSADMLRLNLSIAPNPNPNRFGAAGGDTAGWPNGRRLGDDVIDIAENGLMGALLDPPYAPVTLGDGVDANDKSYLATFPYVALPHEGFANSHGEQKP